MLASIRCGICPPVPITVVRIVSLPLSRAGKTAVSTSAYRPRRTGPRSKRGPAMQRNLWFRQNRPKCSLRASSLVLVPALGELLDDLGAERLEVAGVTARNEALVRDDLLVHPFPASIADVGLEARVRSQGPAA